MLEVLDELRRGPELLAVAHDYLDHAQVGATIEIDGISYPHRPVAVLLGKTVTNGWGGYECCWARTMLAALVGALEVPGGILGTTVRLNRPAQNRLDSVKPGPDGFMAQTLNATPPPQGVRPDFKPTPGTLNIAHGEEQVTLRRRR